VIKVDSHTILCVLYKNYLCVMWPLLYVLHIWCCSSGHKNIRYSRSWLQNLPGEIDIIPTQIGFQHVSGRNLVLKWLILNIRLGKPLNWGTLSDSFIEYFTVNKSQAVLLSALQRLFLIIYWLLKCRLEQSLLGVSSVSSCWSPFCHCSNFSVVSLQ
jgi:hypothetical protein